MKKLLWVLAVLLVVAGVILAIAAYSANSLVARFKPDIEAAASRAVGAPVTLGNISASVFPSVRLKVQEARVAAQPGGADALALKGLVLHVKLLPLLTGRLVVETVSLDQPSVVVVKTKEGMFLEGLPRRATAALAVPGSADTPGPAASRSVGALAAPAALNIDLRTFQINDATVTLHDVENQRDVAIRNITVDSALTMAGGAATVSRLTLNADLPGGQHLSVGGAGQSLNLKSGALALGDVKASVLGGVITVAGAANVYTAAGTTTISADGIKLDDVLPLAIAFAPAMGDTKLLGTVKADLNAAFGAGTDSAAGTVTLQEVAFRRDTLAVSNISGPLILSIGAGKPSVRTDGLSFVLGGKPGKVAFAAVVDGDRVEIAPLSLSALDGSLTGTVEYSLPPPQRFVIRVDGAGFSVAEALALADPRAPVQIEGVVSKLVAQIRGRAEGDVARSLDGTAAFGMKHAVLKGLNLGAAVLQGVNRIPLLAGAVDIPKFQKHMSSKDTTIESLTGDFTIDAGWIKTNNLSVVSELFRLTGSGRVSFQSDLDLDTTITFNPELSRVMIGRAKELRPVLNNDGTLTVPVFVKGRPPNIDARPDLTRLLAGSTKNVLEGTVGGALGKALNGEKLGGKLLDQLLGR